MSDHDDHGRSDNDATGLEPRATARRPKVQWMLDILLVETITSIEAAPGEVIFDGTVTDFQAMLAEGVSRRLRRCMEQGRRGDLSLRVGPIPWARDLGEFDETIRFLLPSLRLLYRVRVDDESEPCMIRVEPQPPGRVRYPISIPLRPNHSLTARPEERAGKDGRPPSPLGAPEVHLSIHDRRTR